MKRFLAKASTLAILGMPFVVLAQVIPAQAATPGTSIDNFLVWLRNLLNSLVPILIAIAVVIFLWGVVQYITAGADEEKRGAARNLMIYGIIGLFVMVSIWGLVRFLAGTFGLTSAATPPDIPTVPEIPTRIPR